MKVTCLKKDLERVVNTVSRIISNTVSLPVLSCVVLEAQGKEIVARATNLELSVEVTFPAEVKTKGSVAIPAQTLLSTLKTSSAEGNVELELTDGTVAVNVGAGKHSIKTIPLDDFPNIPRPETKKPLTIPSAVLIEGFRSVLHSASTSLIKPELASIYIYAQDGHLVFVATDSFRLSEKKVTFRGDDIPEVLIPAKNAQELLRALENQEEGDLEVFIDENQYSLQQNGFYLTSRIIDGSFPDYQSIIPKENTTEAVLLKEDFANTLKKAQIFADSFGQVSFHVYPSKKTFTVSARNADVGEVFDTVDAALTGEDLDINFNHRYVVDSLQSISADSVTLSFAGAGKPLVIRGVSDNSFTYLVMPMNR